MASERNIETIESLKNEIKSLRTSCAHTSQIIENAPPDASVCNLEDIKERNNFYNRGLIEEIRNSNTSISTDSNLLTGQFLKEIKEKNVQVVEMIAFTKGAVQDIDAEINRLNHLITIAKEAKSKPKIKRQEVKPEQFQKAKEKFQLMKTELQGLIQSLFPDCHEAVRDLMGMLMSAKDENNTNGYVQVTPETFRLIEILKDLNIVTTNPYNKSEVKLACH